MTTTFYDHWRDVPETALGLEGLSQAGQKAVEGLGQRTDLARQPLGGNLRQVAGAARLEACAEPAQRVEAETDGENDRRQRDRQDDQQRQAEAHLDLTRDRRAMGQRLGHGDPDRVLKRCVAVEPVGGGLPEPGSVPRREYRRIGRVGLQQDTPLGIPHEVGEELVVLPDRREPLRHALIFAAHDVGHRQREDAFRSLSQGAVEDLVQLAPDDDGSHRRREQPQHRKRQAERQAEPALKARRPFHDLPSL
jgi:hypothetical protein